MNWAAYTTRKVVLGGIAVGLIVSMWVSTQWLLKAADNFGTAVSGMVALYAAFCGANVVQDHILTRNKAQAQKLAFVPTPEPSPPVEPLPEE